MHLVSLLDTVILQEKKCFHVPAKPNRKLNLQRFKQQQASSFFTSNDDYASMKGSQYSLRLANMDIMLR